MLFNTCIDILGNALLLPFPRCALRRQRSGCGQDGAREPGGAGRVGLGGCWHPPGLPETPLCQTLWEQSLGACWWPASSWEWTTGCEKHWHIAQHMLAEIKQACKPLHFCFHSPLRFQMEITRSKLGSMALLPCLFQLVRAHQAFWGMQAKATGTSAEVLTLKYASVLLSWSCKHS